jgi:DNA-binding NarL/FixJ family response regulator
MFVSRGRHGPNKVTGENAEALAIRARLIKKYGSAKARKHPDWPALKQISGKRKIRDDAGKPALKAKLADMVAEGKSQREIATLLGISKSYASKLWREICAEVGED